MRILPPWLDFYSDKLDDASPAHEAKMRDMTRHDAEMLHRYDRNALDREGQLSYDVLDYFLSIQIEGDRFRDYDFPVNQMFGVQSSLPNFMAQTHQVNNRHDADTYIARLDKFPTKFAQTLEGLKEREAKNILPPQFTVDRSAGADARVHRQTGEGEHAVHELQGEARQDSRQDMDQPTRDALLARVEASIDKSVYPAYLQLIDYFTTLQPKAQGNDGAWHLPDGDAYYAWCVRQHTTTDMTPEQVHTLGLAEVARISDRDGCDPQGQGARRGQHRCARAAARARAGIDVSEHAGREGGDARSDIRRSSTR